MPGLSHGLAGLSPAAPPAPAREPEPSAAPAWDRVPAMAAYLACVLWLGSNLFGRWTTHYLGAGELEGWLWRYWWMKEFIAGVWEQRPFDPAFLLYALVSAGSYPEFGNVLDLQVLLWPLDALLGLPLAHSVRTLLVLFLNAVAAYELGRTLWASRPAAWLLGAVFAFNPYFLHEIANGRVRQAVGFTIPLFLLYLVRCWRTGRMADAVLAGLWWGLTGAVYLYYGMWLAFFMAAAAVWWAAGGRRGSPAGLPGRAGVMALVALLVVLPFTSAYLLQVRSGRTLNETVYLVDFPPLSVLLEHQHQVRPRDMLPNSIRRFATDTPSADYPWRWDYDGGAPVAFTAAALLPLVLVRPLPGLWLVGLGLFYTISLGPYLRWGGPEERWLLYPGDGVALPYVWLFKYVPAFARLFSPIRAEVMVYLFLGLVAGHNLEALGRRFAGVRRWAPLVVAVLVLAAGAQARAREVAPLLAVEPAPAPVYRLLALMPPMGIVELPLRTGDYIEFNQSVHGHKVLWSWAESELPRGYPAGRVRTLARSEALRDNGLVRYLEALSQGSRTPGSFTPRDLEQVREAGYRVALLHERGCYHVDPRDGRALFEAMADRLDQTLGPPVLETTEPAPAGLPGRRAGERRVRPDYRLRVYALDPDFRFGPSGP